MRLGVKNEAKQVLPERQERASMPNILRWLGDHRDGFLVAGAALYGLGYLVWAYNAWKNGLGPLPALEFQYLVTGIIPAALIVMAWSGIAFFYKIRKKLLSLFERHSNLQWIIVG